MADKIAYWYRTGLWTAAMVAEAARKGVISQAKASEITGVV